MIGKVLVGAGVLGGVYWAYQKLSFFDRPTKSDLRTALMEDLKGSPKIAEDHFHSALHNSFTKHGQNSVHNTNIL